MRAGLGPWNVSLSKKKVNFSTHIERTSKGHVAPDHLLIVLGSFTGVIEHRLGLGDPPVVLVPVLFAGCRVGEQKHQLSPGRGQHAPLDTTAILLIELCARED